jgi:hypothetical protein
MTSDMAQARILRSISVSMPMDYPISCWLLNVIEKVVSVFGAITRVNAAAANAQRSTVDRGQ